MNMIIKLHKRVIYPPKLLNLNGKGVLFVCLSVYVYIYIYIYVYIYPDTAKHQSKPQVYKSDIAPCGQI